MKEDKKLRCFTISELKMIMSFPFDFDLCNNAESVCYTFLGNAVPPLMAYKIAESIKETINKK
jgi:site-specific DNA-cytosine methylase